jgi:hypothetical protein
MAASPVSGTSTVHTSGATDTHFEDLADVIYNIDKKRNVFLDAIGRGKDATGLLHEWPEDYDASAASNAQVDGADASFSAVTMPTVRSNRIQLLAKWFLISSIQEAVNKAGRKSDVAYQTEKKLRELAKDIEYAALNNTSATAFASGTAGTMNGLKGFLTASGMNKTNFSGSYAATNQLTEDNFNDALEAAHADYGMPDLVLAPSAQKRKISSFDGQNRLTFNADAGKKKVIAAVDYYESDFGVVEVKLVYHLAATSDSGTYYDYLPIIEKGRWKLCYLKGHGVKAEKLAKTGLAEKVQIAAACTLECRNPKANALIYELSRT